MVLFFVQTKKTLALFYSCMILPYQRKEKGEELLFLGRGGRV
jgi:hypothetical protein